MYKYTKQKENLDSDKKKMILGNKNFNIGKQLCIFLLVKISSKMTNIKIICLWNYDFIN